MAISPIMTPSSNEKKVQLVFQISLVLKGVFAVSEIIGGLIAYAIIFAGDIFASFGVQSFVHIIVDAVTQEELTEDPKDFIATHFVQWAQNFSISSLNFAALYLLVHGVIKLWLIVGLLRKRLWYYPTALIVFALFIVYQLYRYSFTHSILLLFITAVDLIVIVLTWHEYKYLRTRGNETQSLTT
jgi:uncharacterized membrane protein